MKFKNSLLFSIIISMLTLAIIPLMIMSYSSYETMKKSLFESAKHELKQSSFLNYKYITNWFFHRELDMNSWSQQEHNEILLKKIDEIYIKQNKKLSKLVHAPEYLAEISKYDDDLHDVLDTYSYIHDILLINMDGDIVYTVEKENDLGKNLLDGKYANTKFAKAYRQTRKDSTIHFSDIEIYEPSNNILAAFFTAPIKDKNEKTIGIYAIQLKLDDLYSLFKNTNNLYEHYIIGEDNLLRSNKTKKSGILKLKIQTAQTDLWHKNHDAHLLEQGINDEFVFLYKNNQGKDVFGLHQNINILGINWALISEVEKETIFKTINKERDSILWFLLITTLIVIMVALYIAKRITKPILNLTNATTLYANGEVDIEITPTSNNEIGKLTRTFTIMIKKIKEDKDKLKYEAKKAEESLKQLDEQKYALDAHSIVAVTDVKGNITFVNNKFIEISGYSEDELIGKNHRIIKSTYHPREFWIDMYKTIANNKIWHNEVCNIAKNGTIYWVDTTIIPFLDANSKVESYIAIRTDITTRKETEEKLLKANEVANQSVKIKSEFLASMSHEIRTPMNGVIGMLNLLMNSQLDDTQHHQASLAQSSANALLTLINDILDFSKVDAGKMELEAIEFDIREELGKFIEAAGFKAQEKGIELILDTTLLEKDLLSADSGRIRQILSNIVGNAVKFTNIGYVLLKAKLIKTDTDDPRLIMEISDSGIGIKKDKIDSLFDSFSQADNSTTRKYGGTGLGLAIVKKLAHLMNGDVFIESEFGKGSVFRINISVEIPKNSKDIVVDEIVKDKKILILDKSVQASQPLSNQLQHWGMSVDELDNEKDIYSALDKNIYDMLIIDMHTPENINKFLDDLTKIKNIKDTKIVIMTTLKDRGDALVFEKLGVDATFPKPATTNDILKALSTFSGKKMSFKEDKPKELKKIKWNQNINILLVEDNLTNQIVANGILETFDLEADIANNGQEALDILNASEVVYDIILMDCQMPIMDGYTTTENIRAKAAGDKYVKIPVIAMTANAMEGDKEKCFSFGMDDYISKPIDVFKLEDVLKKWLPYNEEVVSLTNEEIDKVEILKDDTSILWDKDEALSRLGGSESLLQKIATIFIEDINNEMSKLSKAFDEEKINDIKLHSHTIKGSSANISAVKINNLAKEINDGCLDTSIEELSAEFIELRNAVKETIQIFLMYLEDNESVVESKSIDIGELISKLKALHVELSNGEFIDTEANILFSSSYDAEVDVKLKELKFLVDDFKSEEALTLISSLLQKLEG